MKKYGIYVNNELKTTFTKKEKIDYPLDTLNGDIIEIPEGQVVFHNGNAYEIKEVK